MAFQQRKAHGYHTARHLTWLFCIIWKLELVPQDFKDANVVHSVNIRVRE